MRFDWTDLQVFLQVCDAGSMTAAAQRCHLTLAAVSARIRALEEANELVLLHRQARGVTPTLAGEILARHARLVFEQVQRLERDLLLARGAPVQPLVVLANSSALARPLAPALADCAGDGRTVVVRESASEATVQALRSGAAEVGIVSDAVDTRGLLARELGPDPLVLVVATGHALAACESVPFAAVLGQPWVAWGEQSALSAHLQLRAAALGARLPARFTYPQAAGVLQLVARGAGVTVLPQAVVDLHAGAAVACVRLEERWAQRRLLVCHREGGPALRAQVADALLRAWRLVAPPAGVQLPPV
ncbi:LysR family transcriptional regulator [Ramlibacter sp.]|uniref:LysR family transcriptional regulator n=1 Tax=Ramlibacter sp. TaxID=1917967 RepID=UPI0026367AB0|nr:LysR family transcriptional regulator [Ramlibacter sp.]MDB5957501.1 hypothetical protein [Ramlibacter sp.]